MSKAKRPIVHPNVVFDDDDDDEDDDTDTKIVKGPCLEDFPADGRSWHQSQYFGKFHLMDHRYFETRERLEEAFGQMIATTLMDLHSQVNRKIEHKRSQPGLFLADLLQAHYNKEILYVQSVMEQGARKRIQQLAKAYFLYITNYKKYRENDKLKTPIRWSRAKLDRFIQDAPTIKPAIWPVAPRKTPNVEGYKPMDLDLFDGESMREAIILIKFKSYSAAAYDTAEEMCNIWHERERLSIGHIVSGKMPDEAKRAMLSNIPAKCTWKYNEQYNMK